MANKPTPTKIRAKVIKDRGIVAFKPDKHKRRRLKPIPKPSIDSARKTPLMRYLELVHGEPIEAMILSGSLSVVAKKFDNEVDVSTISKWIKRFKLRYNAENLPHCEGCAHYGPACDSGICYILIESELYDLLPLKRKEVMDNAYGG